MTKNLAEELGPQGINVTVVHPGGTRTERTPRALEEQAQRLGVTLEEAEQRMAQGNSVRRVIDARDIAYVVAVPSLPTFHSHQRRRHRRGRWRWAGHSLLRPEL